MHFLIFLINIDVIKIDYIIYFITNIHLGFKDSAIVRRQMNGVDHQPSKGAPIFTRM